MRRLLSAFILITSSLGLFSQEKFPKGLDFTMARYKEIPEVKKFLKENSLKGFSVNEVEAQVMTVRYESMGLNCYKKTSDMMDRIAKKYPSEIQAMVNTDKDLIERMKAILNEEGIPEHLVYLTYALSGLNSSATTDDGRAGIWMLPYHVAARCNCRLGPQIDERINYDFESQTRCAAKYLKDLHRKYKNWELATQAYIHNPASLNRAINRIGGYEALLSADSLLPKQLRESFYVYEAVAYIAKYCAELGIPEMKLTIKRTVPSQALMMPDMVYMEPLQKMLGIKQDDIKRDNPELRHDVIPKGYRLRLSTADLDKLEASCDSFFNYQDSVYIRTKKKYFIANKERIIEERKIFKRPPGVAKILYKVKSGDNLGFIADWYDVKVSKIQYWNGIRSSRIYAGQQLVIYVPQSKEEYYQQIDGLTFKQKQRLDGRTIQKGGSKPSGRSKPKSGGKTTTSKPKSGNKPRIKKGVSYITYTVKSGDNLWLIAKKYPGISAQNIMDLNGIDSNLQIGQKLYIKEK